MRNKAFKSPFKRGQPGYEIQNKSSGPSEIYIYDEIGFFGVDAQQFSQDLKAMSGDVLVRINSPGGSVFDGMAIAQAIRERKDRTDTVVDGLAASAASYIALAGNEVRITEGAFLMIHEPWSLVIGSAEDMRKEADLLDKVNGQIAGFYAKRTGKPLDEIKEVMAAETWFTGPEALDFGLVDKVDGQEPAQNCFDLSIFNNVPDSLTQPSDSDTLTRRDVEQALRQAGMSRQQAKAFYAEGKHALEPVDQDELWAMAKQLEMKMRG